MPVTNKSPNSTPAAASSNLDLLDLLGGLDLGGPAQPVVPIVPAAQSQASLVNNNLANLFSAQSPTPMQVPTSSNFLIDGFLDTPSPPSKTNKKYFISFHT